MPNLAGSSPEAVRRGAYVLRPPSADDPELVIVASGSEVQLSIAAAAMTRREEVIIELCTWLHGQGARLDAANQAGITPLSHAEKGGRTMLAEWIKAHLNA